MTAGSPLPAVGALLWFRTGGLHELLQATGGPHGVQGTDGFRLHHASDWLMFFFFLHGLSAVPPKFFFMTWAKITRDSKEKEMRMGIQVLDHDMKCMALGHCPFRLHRHRPQIEKVGTDGSVPNVGTKGYHGKELPVPRP